MSKTKLKKITKADITHISFVPKAANRQDFLIVKAEGVEPNLQVEAPILKVDDDKHLVTGVVYTPGVVDTQGEFMEAPAIEEAAHEFLVKHRNTDVRHNFITNEGVEIVESSVAKADYELDGVPIKKGTWTITTKVNDDKLWEGIKKGEYNGFSMGGTGVREEVTVEDGEVNVTKEDDVNGSIAKEAIGFFTAVKKMLIGEKSVEKADDAESVIKAGKSLSSANAAKIKAAHEALSELLSSTEENKEEEDVKKEELEAIVKEAVAPLVAKVEALEKGEAAAEAPAAEGITKEEISAIMKEALAPLEERVSTVEKARGLSRQLEGEGSTITKEEQPFSGIEI